MSPVISRKKVELHAAHAKKEKEAQELTRLLADCKCALHDIDVQIRLLQFIEHEESGNASDIEIEETYSTGEEGRVPVREIVNRAIQRFERFSVADIIRTVRAEEPRAKRTTVVGAIAAAAKTGAVKRLKMGEYERIATSN